MEHVAGLFMWMQCNPCIEEPDPPPGRLCMYKECEPLLVDDPSFGEDDPVLDDEEPTLTHVFDNVSRYPLSVFMGRPILPPGKRSQTQLTNDMRKQLYHCMAYRSDRYPCSMLSAVGSAGILVLAEVRDDMIKNIKQGPR